MESTKLKVKVDVGQAYARQIKIEAMLLTSLELQARIIANQQQLELKTVRTLVFNQVCEAQELIVKKLNCL